MIPGQRCWNSIEGVANRQTPRSKVTSFDAVLTTATPSVALVGFVSSAPKMAERLADSRISSLSLCGMSLAL